MARLFTRSALALAVVGLVVAVTGAADTVVNSAAGTHHCRVSKIEDLKVQNQAGEDIGKIKDMVVDVNTGKIMYVALDFGGFLGIGDKLFAVPWTSLKMHNTSPQKPGEHVLVLNVSKERLKSAPGFDKEHWPDMANPNWSKDVDRYYTPEGNASVTR
jgi:sporulation protein YlmC with PRC-barrel domain